MYGKVLTLHCVRLSSAKLSNFELTDNNKNYLKTGYMVYTTAQINRNFRIKVSGVNGEGAYINTLVGVSGLLRLIGEKLANNLLTRAFNCLLGRYNPINKAFDFTWNGQDAMLWIGQNGELIEDNK